MQPYLRAGVCANYAIVRSIVNDRGRGEKFTRSEKLKYLGHKYHGDHARPVRIYFSLDFRWWDRLVTGLNLTPDILILYCGSLAYFDHYLGNPDVPLIRPWNILLLMVISCPWERLSMIFGSQSAIRYSLLVIRSVRRKGFLTGDSEFTVRVASAFFCREIFLSLVWLGKGMRLMPKILLNC